ncbi:hypothetical protein WESB_0685 [Brachyspira pilosicoli WesB]|uniref:Uncharacterized protein n=1 Tax=Brachyspira pilosicoli WesB TaxID=1161918 RepID=K0JIN5_BRAPL|nr:hypothetical protein [Brachyspira pilosicoli]CCG56155.1 hypothetical protein WESB_0685 [Brachyspira pilosicoli WesB]
MAELEKFSALYGSIDYPADLLTTPFEVLEYRTRLGLTASEFEFICWIFHLVNKDFHEIRDKDISRRCTRQRKSLQAKGYLKIKIARTYKDKRCIKVGLVYDFTNLKNRIEELKEEDKKLQNLEAPVTVVYDEPSLFNEDIDEKSIYPAKLLTDDKEIEEIKLQNEFLEKFNRLHKLLLNFEINYTKSGLYKKHLLDAFDKRNNNNIDEVLNTVKKSFFKLPIEERKSLRIQDLVKYALLETQEPIQNNNKNKIGAANMSIPKGLDKLNYLLKILEEGGNIDEAYAQIANCS